MTGPDPAPRRALLAAAASVAVVTVVPSVSLRVAAEERGEDTARGKRWGLLIDAEACAEGCTACVDACATENGLTQHDRPGKDPQWIRKLTLEDPASGARRSLPVMCQHCADAPCVQVCPTGASFRRSDGIVLVDGHLCIGSRYCVVACPYAARGFVYEDVEGQKPHTPRGRGIAEGCTLCAHRVDTGGTPACVEACSASGHAAMVFGDLNDPDSAIARRVAQRGGARIRADLQTDPSVRYSGI